MSSLADVTLQNSEYFSFKFNGDLQSREEPRKISADRCLKA